MNAIGRLFVISAPSGSGKSTLCGMMIKKYPHISYSVSYTTRVPRGDEIDGKDYRFISRPAFQEMIAGNEFMEWAEVHGNFYGTGRQAVNAALSSGSDIFLDIDPQGAMQLKNQIKNAVYIFITAPSLSALRERLVKRGTDDAASIDLRMKNAKKEISYFADYDYLIVNDESQRAFDDLEAIYRAEKLRTAFIAGFSDFIDI